MNGGLIMAMSIDRVVSELNDLIETCRDGEEGFRHAADNVDDPDMKSLFESYSRQRGDFVRDLQAEVRRLGGDPEKRGSVAGTLHRGWINIRSAVSRRDVRDIVAECERGEDVAVSNYRDTLAKDLPEDVRSLVNDQYMEIQDAHDHISALQRSMEHGPGKPGWNY
jgi:uncharacterized protein (TIGR02284 family)